MLKLFFLITQCIAIIPLVNSQQPVLVVKGFEYIWDREYGSMAPTGQKRVILAEQDSINHKITESITKAFQNRWNIKMPESLLDVRPLGVLSNEPKFTTKIKNKAAGNWYLFLQFFDKRNSRFSEEEKLSGYLTAKCKLINGDNDSVIHERQMLVTYYKEQTPDDQLTLLNLPGYPPSFIQSFDSIAQWLFQAEPANNKSVTLRAACIFDETKSAPDHIQSLSFEADRENISHTTVPSFSLQTISPVIKRTDARRNRSGNVASGALTVLTGISTNKTRQYDYEADFAYKEDDTAWHCIINYTERETGSRERVKDESSNSYSFNSSGYGLQDRFINTSSLNFIRMGNDTMAVFTVQYEKVKDAYSGYSKIWNGIDSSSVLSMPEKWNNKGGYENIIISGRRDSSSFMIKFVKDKKVKQVFIEDKLVAVVYGRHSPSSGFVYGPVSGRQLRIFTILSSLPYNHFNVHLSD